MVNKQASATGSKEEREEWKGFPLDADKAILYPPPAPGAPQLVLSIQLKSFWVADWVLTSARAKRKECRTCPLAYRALAKISWTYLTYLTALFTSVYLELHHFDISVHTHHSPSIAFQALESGSFVLPRATRDSLVKSSAARPQMPSAEMIAPRSN